VERELFMRLTANCSVEFQKCRQYFIRSHNEPLFRHRDARRQSRLFSAARFTGSR
jgi:hypothetical protein